MKFIFLIKFTLTDLKNCQNKATRIATCTFYFLLNTHNTALVGAGGKPFVILPNECLVDFLSLLLSLNSLPYDSAS